MMNSLPHVLRYFRRLALWCAWPLSASLVMAVDSTSPIVSSDLVFAERGGLVAVEAEHFVSQSSVERRAFHITSSTDVPQLTPDADPPHLAGVSGGAYVEVLPDSRRNHSEKLIHGENFSNKPGELAVLTYQVHFATTGRYYVWVRACSTGSEDNGLHVGIDGTWPESGQRMQWCEGKRTWRWESKQRTEAEHCGEPYKIFLDVTTPGVHQIHFSMREDGFEFDRWLMTTDRELERPEGIGPEFAVYAGESPEPFPWVEPPTVATVDDQNEPLPGSPSATAEPLAQPRGPDGDGSVRVMGELMQWHKVTLDVSGPFAHEKDNAPNPFVNYQMDVTLTHESGSPSYVVPGYFAADGMAAETSAQSGNVWRAHLTPDKPGRWNYEISFLKGTGIVETDYPVLDAVDACHGKQGSFEVADSNKSGRDFRALGRLQYVDQRYLRFAESGEYFLKAGPDAPETLLAYADFDDTRALKSNVPLKTWEPHVQDWKPGDPTWQDGKGKGLIGAVNYIASKGCNVISFLPYNAGGDGDNVWPFISRDDKMHYDCSKLDQWSIVFDHATARGIYLHFKMQENEIDDDRRGQERNEDGVPESLDGGKLGPERRLYVRELVARFGHGLALNWNLGEENTQSTEEQVAMIRFIKRIDPYDHNVVVHTFPGQQDRVYTPLLGPESGLTGASLQNSWEAAHQRTLLWIRKSTEAGQPWVVCNDEQNPASHGVPPDPGYEGHSGFAKDGDRQYSMHDVRKRTLWGTLLAGGAGVEYYFGYQLPQNDLICQDFRSRDKSWDYCRIALDFFRDHQIPIQDMQCRDELVGNSQNANGKYCFAKAGELYLVYLPEGGSTELDLSEASGEFRVEWFNPRSGGALQTGSIERVNAGRAASLGTAPNEPEQDWLIVIKRP